MFNFSTINDTYVGVNHNTREGAFNNLLEIVSEIANENVYGTHLKMLSKWA